MAMTLNNQDFTASQVGQMLGMQGGLANAKKELPAMSSLANALEQMEKVQYLVAQISEQLAGGQLQSASTKSDISEGSDISSLGVFDGVERAARRLNGIAASINADMSRIQNRL